MLVKNTAHYNMQFYDSYVIIERISEFTVDSKLAKETLKTIVDHFKENWEYQVVKNLYYGQSPSS